jgi:ABC-type transporter Mla MlaB component
MSKEEAAPGLLSKMVKFVRNPTTSWSDLDQAEADREDSMSKQLLKEMIERKRRNDFVRKREFDMLRKMRKREAMAGTDPDVAGRPSFFQSSMPSKPDDRASTLKKIDEIEAQMSMQWWKTKNGGGQQNAAPAPGLPESRGGAANQPAVDHHLPLSYSPTEPAGLQSAVSAPAASAPLRAAPAPTPVKAPAPAPGQAPQRPPLPMAPPAPPAAPANASAAPVSRHPSSSFGFASPASDFSSSKFFAVENGAVFTHDTELEEAAIRFANGDDQGAEAGLLDILGPGGPRQDHPETWLTLFDLYRASEQQDKFELAAIQFVERFSRSAPQWFSMPAMVKMLTPPPAAKSGNGPASDWICPSVVGIQTVAALKAALAKAAMPWCLDWTNLKTIEASAVEPLYQVFSAWATEPVRLHFIGDAQLQKVLQTATPSNDRGTAQDWWQLRLQALRVTHRPDDFELAALDFCVTYEVSPPAWESARCKYKPVDLAGGTPGSEAIIGDVYRDFASSRMILGGGDSQIDSQMSLMPPSNVLAVELSGTIQGDAIAVLDKLGHKLNGADIMLISCAKLIRVDFSAAGTLLNWVAARQAENRAVQFSEVNRLVAAFFNVIGISENAKVVVRID